MNERILEIAKQAGLKFPSETDLSPPEKKFAELIVKECMTTILKESKWHWDKDEFESSNAILNATIRVKEHFGV